MPRRRLLVTCAYDHMDQVLSELTAWSESFEKAYTVVAIDFTALLTSKQPLTLAVAKAGFANLVFRQLEAIRILLTFDMPDELLY